jgi:hypothetical protein
VSHRFDDERLEVGAVRTRGGRRDVCVGHQRSDLDRAAAARRALDRLAAQQGDEAAADAEWTPTSASVMSRAASAT